MPEQWRSAERGGESNGRHGIYVVNCNNLMKIWSNLLGLCRFFTCQRQALCLVSWPLHRVESIHSHFDYFGSYNTQSQLRHKWLKKQQGGGCLLWLLFCMIKLGPKLGLLTQPWSNERLFPQVTITHGCCEVNMVDGTLWRKGRIKNTIHEQIEHINTGLGNKQQEAQMYTLEG